MRKFIFSLFAALFLSAVSVPVFAADTTPASTPAAKMMKHKKVHHKKGMSKGKKGMKPAATPMAK